MTPAKSGALLLILVFSMSAAAQQRLTPDHILYKHFFDHVAAFREEADRMDLLGQDGSGLRFYFQKRLNLSFRGNEQLQVIALKYSAALRLNKEQVRAVVQAEHAKNMPGNRLRPGEAPPPPPPKLHALYLARKAIIQQANAELSNTLAPSAVNQINSYVHSHVAAGTYRLNR